MTHAPPPPPSEPSASYPSLPPPSQASMPQPVRAWLRHKSVDRLTRLAAALGSAGLLIMMLSVVHPKPITVILSMTAGQLLGGAAFACYLLAVLVDVSKRRSSGRSMYPPPGE